MTKDLLFFFFISATIILSSNPLRANGREPVWHDADSSKLKGIVIKKNKFSKRFSILMLDTTLGGNRFNYSWHKGPALDGRMSSNYNILPAFLVDSSLAAYCDSLLLFNPENAAISLTGWPKRKTPTLVRKCIRLYIGYIDAEGNRNIVVQFASTRDFKKYELIYSKELFLVVPRKELHFAIINLGH